MKKHLQVEKRFAERVIRQVKQEGFIDYDYKIQESGGYLLIPLREDANLDELKSFKIIEEKAIRNERRVNPLRISGSYDTIGSIAVTKESDPGKLMELSRNLIESGKGIRSVYRDRGVRGDARIRDLELVMGEDNRKTIYRENGITLMVDLSKAYFSPRLATERFLLAKRVRDGEKIIDMFSGIGPFSILIAAVHDVDIVAIDSNPDAVELLKENIKMNRLRGKITPLKGNSAEVLRSCPMVDRIIMNFPTGAYRFIEPAALRVREGGRINYYEISTYEEIESRMENFMKLGLRPETKREVHAYSKTERMFSIELIKEADNTTGTIGQNNIRRLDTDALL